MTLGPWDNTDWATVVAALILGVSLVIAAWVMRGRR